jgi:hypothetical protein
MNDAARKSMRVLIGPTYLEGVRSVTWSGELVLYLHKVRSAATAGSGHIYYDDRSIQDAVSDSGIDADLGRLIVDLNQDINCYFLAERERKDLFDGAFLAPIEISNCARYAWSILVENRIELLIFHNHPHELFTYVLKEVALRLGISTLLVHFAALPWRMAISRYEIDGSTTKLKLRSESSSAERQSVAQYIARLRSTDHERAVPSTDVKLITSRGSPLDVSEELRSAARGAIVKNVLRIIRKRRLYHAFASFVRQDPGTPYVAFLMHYQPEEATLPRGGVFAQQLNVIVKLRALLPPSVNILVKENRATFRAPLTLATAVRSRAFYKAVASVPGTYLVPLQRDTFELIDHSLAVATITGTVGLEALVRGKRVLIFGDATYREFSGVTRADFCDYNGAVLQFDGQRPHDPAVTVSDLMEELLHSIGSSPENNQSNYRSQQQATIEAFTLIASNLDELARAEQL